MGDIQKKQLNYQVSQDLEPSSMANTSLSLTAHVACRMPPESIGAHPLLILMLITVAVVYSIVVDQRLKSFEAFKFGAFSVCYALKIDEILSK